MGILEKIKSIEEELARTQKNKATEHHTGMLKGQLAKLRSQLLDLQSKKGGGGDGFEAKKAGDARVVLIGFPSVGKSTLLNKITKTKSATAAYEYTTLTCVPGVLEMNGSKIQVLDLPGIIEGASKGKGRGKQVIAIARTANLILLMLDASKGKIHKALLLKELENSGIICNKQPPNISFHIRTKGGINITTTVEQTHGVNDKLIHDLLKQRKLHHIQMVIRQDATIDEIIDIIEGNRVYVKCLFCYNKIDTITIEELDEKAKEENSIVVSLAQNLNVDALKKRIWDMLDLKRIYTKTKGRGPDFIEPYIVKSFATVETICRRVHDDVLKNFKYGMVWGKSAKYESGQIVGLSHLLADEDVLQIYLK